MASLPAIVTFLIRGCVPPAKTGRQIDRQRDRQTHAYTESDSLSRRRGSGRDGRVTVPRSRRVAMRVAPDAWLAVPHTAAATACALRTPLSATCLETLAFLGAHVTVCEMRE